MCDRLKILPNLGGLLEQDDLSIKKLSGVLPLIDEYNNEQQEAEMKKSKNEGKSGSNS